MTENNKLIAEFMGAAKGWIKVPGRGRFQLHKVAYDTSWDWLMPVVEKISRIQR